VGAIISQGWAKSFRAGGRHHLGVPGAIIPEPGARSFRIAGRHRPESAVDDVKNENVLIGGCVAYLELMERPTPEITAFRAFWAAKNDPDFVEVVQGLTSKLRSVEELARRGLCAMFIRDSRKK
jgi:hypothetical protein